MLAYLRELIGRKRSVPLLHESIDPQAASPDVLAALGVVRPIEFVWIWIRDEYQYGTGIELASESGAFIETLFPPVCACWFGAFPHIPLVAGARERLIVTAQERFGSSAKARYGVVDACIKNVGSATRFAMIVSCDSRGDILSALSAQEFGTFLQHAPKG